MSWEHSRIVSGPSSRSARLHDRIFWNHDDPIVGNGKALPVSIEVVADHLACGDLHSFIKNRTADARMVPDLDVIEHNALFHKGCVSHRGDVFLQGRD